MRTKIKSPNRFVYAFTYALLYPLLKLIFHFKVDRKNFTPPEGPFILLCNHSSFMDFLLVMLAVYPLRVNAVAAQKFFFYRPLDKILTNMGCIPKNLFDPDPRAIKSMSSVLKRGDGILMFPEGRCSVDGKYMGMHKATGKLVKIFGVSVYACHIRGAYNCLPLWRGKIKYGRIRATLENVLTTEDTKILSKDEINEKIDESLGGFHELPSNKPLKVFHGKCLTEGLDNLLYYCPKCEEEFTLVTQGNSIHCTACGNAGTMDKFGNLSPIDNSIIPKDVAEWYRLEVLHEKHFMNTGMAPIHIPVSVRTPVRNGYGIKVSGKGILSLDETGWSYEGELDGQEAKEFFPIDTVPALPFDPGDNFQIYSKGSFMAFMPEDLRWCAKWATVGECAYWCFSSEVQMTPGDGQGFSET